MSCAEKACFFSPSHIEFWEFLFDYLFGVAESPRPLLLLHCRAACWVNTRRFPGAVKNATAHEVAMQWLAAFCGQLSYRK